MVCFYLNIATCIGNAPSFLTTGTPVLLGRCLRAAVYSMLITRANLSRTNVKALCLNNGTVVRIVVRQWRPNAFRLVAPSAPKTTEHITRHRARSLMNVHAYT